MGIWPCPRLDYCISLLTNVLVSVAPVFSQFLKTLIRSYTRVLHSPCGYGFCSIERRGRWEGGSGWGIHVNPWLIHVNAWQKPLQYCKVISLQLIKINEKKKKTLSLHADLKGLLGLGPMFPLWPSLLLPTLCSFHSPSLQLSTFARVVPITRKTPAQIFVWLTPSSSSSVCSKVSFIRTPTLINILHSIPYILQAHPLLTFLIHLISLYFSSVLPSTSLDTYC